MVVWTNTLVDPNLKASTKKKCQLKSGGGWIYLSLVIWYQPPTILNVTFCDPWDYPYLSSTFWHSNAKCQVPYTVMISTRNGMATNTARKTSSNGHVLESLCNTWQLKDLLHPKFSVTWISCKPGAVSFWSSLVLLSFRSQHNLGDKKKRRKVPQKPEAMSTFLAAHTLPTNVDC